MPAVATIKKRPDFLAVRGGVRASCAACLIECRPRTGPGAEPANNGPRFGFTVTRKLGNAVVRNRIRRRLKAAIADLSPRLAQSGYDYVVVARKPALGRPFGALISDLSAVLETLHRSKKKGEAAQTGKSTDEAAKKAAT